jgi:methylglutaconyl-CoA hydratase
MPEAPILVENPAPGIVVVTLNRPERRNALNAVLLETLCEAIEAAEASPGKRVLVLRGAGQVFCAGLDLKEAMDAAAAEHNAHLVLRALRTLGRTRLITIAAVHGAAMAGGAGLMAACDFALAADDAKIGFPEVHRGLVAALVMCFVARQIPGRHVRSLLLLGHPIDAKRAEEIGLINEAVPATELEDRTMRLAADILSGAPAAVERTKLLLEQLSPWDLSEDLDAALRHHTDARESLEAQEGLLAFLEKRPPMWQTHVREDRP